MRGEEELKHVEAFTEVGSNGKFHGFAGGSCHQAAHAGKLGYLSGRTAGTGVCHHADRIELVQVGENLLAQIVRAFRPEFDDVIITFIFTHETVTVHLVDAADLFIVGGQHFLLGRRNLDIRNGHGDSGTGGVLVAQCLDLVKNNGALVLALTVEAHVHDVGQLLFTDQAVNFEREHVIQTVPGLEAHVLGQGVIEDQLAQRAVDETGIRFTLETAGNTDLDRRLKRNLMLEVSHFRFVLIAEYAAGARILLVHNGQIVASDHHVLGRLNDGLAVLRLQNVVVSQHQEAGFGLGFQGERHVHSHLVAVEVSVESGTGQRMQLDGLAFHQHRFEGLNAQTVQGRSTVQKHGMITNDIFQNIPDFRACLFHLALGGLDIVCLFQGNQLFHDEGLEEFKRHVLGKTALVKLEFRTNHDNASAGVVNTLAEQVLTETSLLAAEQIAEGFQGTVSGTGDRTSAAAVVDQSVNGFLKHALLVADNDVRGAEVHKALQTVVAVDDAAVQVIQVGSGETSAFQLHHGAQIRGNDRYNGKNHPFRLVTRGTEGFHHFKALDGLGPLLALGLTELSALAAALVHGCNLLFQLSGKGIQIQGSEHVQHGFRAHLGDKGTAAAAAFHFTDLGVVHKLILLESGHIALGRIRVAGIENDEIHEIQDFFQRLGADVQQHAHTAGNTLEVPDMADRGGQFDMAHPLAAHLCTGDLNAALVADLVLVLVLYALVFSAGAFPVLGGSEDALAVEAVALRAQRSVVDGFRFGDFAVRPFLDLFR